MRQFTNAAWDSIIKKIKEKNNNNNNNNNVNNNNNNSYNDDIKIPKPNYIKYADQHRNASVMKVRRDLACSRRDQIVGSGAL